MVALTVSLTSARIDGSFGALFPCPHAISSFVHHFCLISDQRLTGVVVMIEQRSNLYNLNKKCKPL